MPGRLTAFSTCKRIIGTAVYLLVLMGAGAVVLSEPAAAAPAIRTSSTNVVPSCVTPARLMAFLTARNTSLDRRYADIAAYYKSHGEALRVRWDYAFFQMLIETNFLTFLRGNAKPGDVHPRQNNFAGLGTTGGGVPGDSFPDVSTGVRGQIEHLVVYSGERLPAPVAPRTRLKQDDILAWTVPLSQKRPVTFQDLAGRWAVDRSYGRSIEAIAERFRAAYCTGDDVAAAKRTGPANARPEPPPTDRQAVAALPTTKPRPPAHAIRPEPSACRVLTASYGGSKTILIRHVADDAVEFTALQVLDGFERSMTDSFLKVHAPGGTVLGEFASVDDAFARAFKLCPGAGRGAG